MNIIILDIDNNPVVDANGKALIFRGTYKPQAFYDTYIKNMYTNAVRWIEYREENIDSLNLELIRKRRDVLLTECDWTMLPDTALTEGKKEEWRVYRQVLRDITQNFDMTKPQLIIWPNRP